MTKPHEENWIAVKTQQGAWVRGVDGEAIAMVYNPMANVVSGDTMKERMDDADALAFARAQEMAAAPDMARALMGPSGKGHHHYNPQRDEYTCQQCAHFAPSHSDGCEFGKALRKAGILL